MFSNTNNFQILLNKIKHDKNNPVKNDKVTPDVKTNISAYDKVVKIVTNNDSHVNNSKDVKTNTSTLHEKEKSKKYRL